jgi:hypothetical protein
MIAQASWKNALKGSSLRSERTTGPRELKRQVLVRSALRRRR